MILQMIKGLPQYKIAVVKFDCLTSSDQEQYQNAGVTVVVGYAGKLCPDHFFVTNVQDAFDWAKEKGFDLLITESAGLCNRCSPHIQGVPAVSSCAPSCCFSRSLRQGSGMFSGSESSNGS